MYDSPIDVLTIVRDIANLKQMCTQSGGFICLVTGSLWGRPTWGTYWVWDARLTSVLVLFLLYLGVLALYWTTEDPGRGSRAAAVLTLVGAVNLPIF